MGVVFGILGVIFRVQKKSRKKERKNELILKKETGPAECAGPLGNLLEGSKLCRKVKSNKKQSKKKN